MSGPSKLRGLRAVAFYGGITGVLGAALYAVVVYPYLNIEKYKEIQKLNRSGIDQASVQPGGMKVWSDPFDRRKE